MCVICVNDEAVTHCRQLWNIAGDYLKSDKNSRQLLLAVDGCSVLEAGLEPARRLNAKGF